MKRSAKPFALCVDNTDYKASLTTGKVYRIIPDARAAKDDLVRIAARVKQGSHNVPREDVLRRFERSWSNFLRVYRPIADRWSVYDNSGSMPILIEESR